MITGSTEDEIMKMVDVVKTSSFFKKIVNFFSTIKRRTVVDIIIIAIPIILIYVYMTGINPSEIRQTLKDNKKIEVKVDSLKMDNQFIVSRMYELEKNQTMFYDMMDKNNNLIKANNKELLNLKRIYNAKINSINNFNVSQLDSFFTNRYKEFYNR